MQPRLWIALLVLAMSAFLSAQVTTAQAVLPRTTPPPTTVRPRPIVFIPSTAKPQAPAPTTAKPAGPPTPTTPGPRLPSPNYVLAPPCSQFNPANLVDNVFPVDSRYADVQQCKAFSTYTFDQALPTPQQKQLLCGQGCFPLIDRLMKTPLPICSVVLSNYAINYVHALNIMFAQCLEDASQGNLDEDTPTATAETPTTTSAAPTPRPVANPSSNTATATTTTTTTAPSLAQNSSPASSVSTPAPTQSAAASVSSGLLSLGASALLAAVVA